MAIDIQCKRRCVVPQIFLQCFDVIATLQGNNGVGMTEIMKTRFMKRFVKCFFELLTQIIVKVRKCKVQRVCVLHFQLAGSGGCFFLMKLYH